MKYLNSTQPAMFYGAPPITFGRAKKLRQNLTIEERVIWDFLKSRPFSLKFRRQHPIGFYIADFYCHSIKLVIEIDGGYHLSKQQRIKDQERERQMAEWGIRILRFSNDIINCHFESVKSEILTALNNFRNS